MRDQPTFLHLDLDAFFASVEQRDDPTLRGRPVIVGGTGGRGVVAAASYEAREFGVRSAMPTIQAERLCPNAVFLPPRFDAYQKASRAVMKIMSSVTSLVEPLSLDEAFLDVAGSMRRFGDPLAVAEFMRLSIKSEVGLTASVGGATTKMLAKIASDLAKPDGVLIVKPGDELKVLHPLPVTRLWGVGPATRERLERFGVKTIGDLSRIPEATLVGALGAASGKHLHALSWNRDERGVQPDQETKSVSHEETFSEDKTDRIELARELSRMTERVGARLRSAGLAGRTIQVKVKYHDFRQVTRSATLDHPTDLAGEIGPVARDLLGVLEIAGGVRLLGVSVTGLSSKGERKEQLSLDSGAEVENREARRALELAVDAVRERFGDDSLGSGAAIDDGRVRTDRKGSLYGPLADSDQPPPRGVRRGSNRDPG
jgi:DNA polymerase-4